MLWAKPASIWDFVTDILIRYKNMKRIYWPSSAQHLIDDLRQARVTNIDTDSAGQFVVGYLHNMRMASILSVITNRLDNTWSTDDSSERRACRAACEALHILQQRDRHKSSFRL